MWKINCWDDFVLKVLILNRRDWKLSPVEYADAMRNLRQAYYKGSRGDVTEEKLRYRQIKEIKLNDMPYFFRCPEEEMIARLKRARVIAEESLKAE